jgi:hypothetical protein
MFGVQRIMVHHLVVVTVTLFLGDSLSGSSSSQHQVNDGCWVPEAFVKRVGVTLSDTTGRFFNDYPDPTPLTCEVLAMLQEELKDDSVRYHFEHLHQRYDDPRAVAAFTFIQRHIDFALAMALTTHWNPDTRIEAVKAVNHYRRIRPMVCATQEHYAQLEEQDRAAVRYFIKVMETTPLVIDGSENSTIHSIYMRNVMETLDRFTGQQHLTSHADDLRIHLSEADVQQYLIEWKKWLNR